MTSFHEKVEALGDEELMKATTLVSDTATSWINILIYYLNLKWSSNLKETTIQQWQECSGHIN